MLRRWSMMLEKHFVKHFIGICVITLFFTAPLTPFSAQAKINIFACEPEWASLAEEIGGNKVKAFSATHAKQDAHHIRARPSLIAKARRADLIFCSGAGLEVGWLPILLQKAKSDVQQGGVGHLIASDIVPVLEKPAMVDRSMGDIHPEGNPHIHLNPHNILLVAKELTKRLQLIDAPNANFYSGRLKDFTTRWQDSISHWEKDASALKGMPVVVHHKSLTYLFDWLGIKRVGSLEPKPGIPPTISHLETLLESLKSRSAQLILRTPYDPHNASQWLSEKTNIQALVLPFTIGGDDQSGDLFALFDRSISLLKEAMGGSQ